MIKLLGVIPDMCVEEYIVNFFNHLRVQKRNLHSLDPTLAKFENLKVLNLSFNSITRIEFLPPNLEELYLNGNMVNEVALNPSRPFTKLIHLGLSMNKI
jgi:Leucine-rich repeat (LRR) protein